MTNAGYSGTPLPKKMGISPTSRVMVIRPVSGFLEGVAPFDSADEELDVAVVFCKTLKELEEAFELRHRLKPNGGLWISWPKKASKIPTEISEDVLRAVGLPLGIVDNKVCAIDEQWSGLRFVWRKELRKGLEK